MLAKIGVKCHNKTQLFGYFFTTDIAGLSSAEKTKQLHSKITELRLFYI